MSLYKIPPAEETWEWANRMSALRHDFIYKDNYFNRLRIAGQYWKDNEERIIRNSERNPRYWFHPEVFDWHLVFSPIEMDAWMSLRGRYVPMYPQYPVLKYYVDFGNPYFKIAIELDGKDYHDPVKDRKRDIELHQSGWKVIRIPGIEMVKTFRDTSDFESWEWQDNNDEVMEAMYHWILETGDGVIEAISRVYFTKQPLSKVDRELYSLCHRTLQNHCLLENHL
jgi:hypothetical protein